MIVYAERKKSLIRFSESKNEVRKFLFQCSTLHFVPNIECFLNFLRFPITSISWAHEINKNIYYSNTFRENQKFKENDSCLNHLEFFFHAFENYKSLKERWTSALKSTISTQKSQKTRLSYSIIKYRVGSIRLTFM